MFQKFCKDKYGEMIEAECYCGGQDIFQTDRRLIQDKFMTTERMVLFATKAFGMGVNKPDIRYIYNWQMPVSLEEYVQQSGRAGRDGKPANSILFYHPHDSSLVKRMFLSNHPHEEFFKCIFEKLQEKEKLEPEKKWNVDDLFQKMKEDESIVKKFKMSSEHTNVIRHDVPEMDEENLNKA